MNRLASVAVVLVSVAGAVEARSAWGQASGSAGGGTTVAAPVAIPADARTSPAPEAFRPQIEAFVKGNLARLKSGDGAAAAAARTALVSEVTGAATTSSYKDLFGATLASQLGTLAGDPDARVRLQAGVLAAKVAQASDNTQMSPVATKLLGDSNLGVVIWGLKAARGVLAFQASLPAGMSGSALPAAVASAVAKVPESGEVVRDGYDALQLDVTKLPGIRAATIQQLAPHVSAILASRSKIYLTKFPEFADADRDAATFFSNFAFAGLPQAEKTKVVQHLADIVLLSALRGAEASGPQQKALLDHAVNVGKNLYIIAQEIDKKSTPQTAALLRSVQFFRNVGPITPPADDVISAAKATFTALKTVPDYKGLVESALGSR